MVRAAGEGSVLVVDDDAHIRELCTLYLVDAGFRVSEAPEGVSGLALVERDRPDLVILDVMLPGLDGWEVLNRIRQQSAWLPVMMLTAVGDEADRVAGLELGADDYLTKPFSPKEMVARVKAVLRRASLVIPEGHEPSLVFGSLVIDPKLHRASVDGDEISLTPKEFELLWFLASHPHQVFERNQLLDRVWGIDFFGDGRTVDVHITRLRHKLQKYHGPEKVLETVWGLGYRFNPKPPSTPNLDAPAP
ncbi:MAG: response regulator transcription factor [Firmicutes bacterium]|jgi:two-component system response regulator ResD|nr:response regulator transcription factor [Bacillota bacterium]MCL5065301.1 response regulator transcription factor [Bacillota bacterium]